ncbi:MAG: hypothetical protein E7E84_07525, partial [Peptoniphilus lacydonensis]|uniref:hypothetical protein n=1 Tax=Peptoniphilus lacydonensis TaxID=1673725 RepID=UPI002901424F
LRWKMKLKESTKWQLKKIIGDLNYEASEYEWGSEEYEFLSDVACEIEDGIWGLKDETES